MRRAGYKTLERRFPSHGPGHLRASAAAGVLRQLPVYSDRSGWVSWYTVQLVGDTTIERKSRGPEAVWEVMAQPDSAAPQARYWISRHHRVVSRVLLSEPGISLMYARD